MASGANRLVWAAIAWLLRARRRVVEDRGPWRSKSDQPDDPHADDSAAAVSFRTNPNPLTSSGAGRNSLSLFTNDLQGASMKLAFFDDYKLAW